MSISSNHHTVETSRAFVEVMKIHSKGSGPLDGLKFAVKDIIDIAGYKTACGNPDWRDTHPVAAINAVCVDQLLSAGAECSGKTIMDEFGFGLDGENFFYGTPLNPKAPDRVPGGSSSGSASAVACGLVDFAVGTDTGGSVRVPASNCGIFGMRPSHGFISVAGVNPFAPTFDTVGVLASSVDNLERAVSVLLGCDVPFDVEPRVVLVIKEAWEIADNDVKEVFVAPLQRLKSMKEISLREIALDVAASELGSWYETFRTLQWAEIWSGLGSWIEQTKPKLGPRTEVNFQLARSADRGNLVDAWRRREEYFRRICDFLGPEDLLCIPTTPAVAPSKGSLGNDRTKSEYFLHTLALNSIAGIGRLPQISLPIAEITGIPIGVSLLARRGQDAFLVAAAKKIAGL